MLGWITVLLKVTEIFWKVVKCNIVPIFVNNWLSWNYYILWFVYRFNRRDPNEIHKCLRTDLMVWILIWIILSLERRYRSWKWFILMITNECDFCDCFYFMRSSLWLKKRKRTSHIWFYFCSVLRFIDGSSFELLLMILLWYKVCFDTTCMNFRNPCEIILSMRRI